MKYRPRWERILLLGVMLNGALMFAGATNFFEPAKAEEPEELVEVAWVDSPAAEVATAPPPTAFPEINLPPIEIPKIEVPALPEPTLVEKPAEPAQQVQPAEQPAEVESPTQPEDPASKLKALVKVYPKDLIAELVASGAVKERVAINGGKVVLSVTIGTDGKVKNVEIRRGGGSDERGNIINLVAEAAAGGWIFEPYLDADGKPVELKTQIEFKPEDF